MDEEVHIMTLHLGLLYHVLKHLSRGMLVASSLCSFLLSLETPNGVQSVA